MSTWDKPLNRDETPREPSKLEGTLNGLAALATLTLLVCAPALAIGLWKWAIG